VISMFEKTGFAVERAEERPETLLVVATA